MAKKKMDYFNQAGVVSPMEYPWYEQFQKMGKMMYSDPKHMYQVADVGKLLGLARYTTDLQQAARSLAESVRDLIYSRNLHVDPPEVAATFCTAVDDVMNLTDHPKGKK